MIQLIQPFGFYGSLRKLARRFRVRPARLWSPRILAMEDGIRLHRQIARHRSEVNRLQLTLAAWQESLRSMN